MTAAATALEHFVMLPSAQQGDAIVRQIDLRKRLGVVSQAAFEKLILPFLTTTTKENEEKCRAL